MPRVTLIVLMLFLSFNAQVEYRLSQKAKSIFKHKHPCPATGRIKGSCPSWIIDHIKPLACGARYARKYVVAD